MQPSIDANNSDTRIAESFHNVISADTSTFLVIDHQRAFSSCYDTGDLASADRVVGELLKLASALNIPTLASVVETNRISAVLSPLTEAGSDNMQIVSRSVANPWDDACFFEAVNAANRPKLIVSGLSAECSLTLTVLCALEQGFDVYVVRDACLGFTKETLEASFERLKQAGAVIVSWRQVITEWHQGSLDGSLLRRYLKTKRADRKPTPKVG